MVLNPFDPVEQLVRTRLPFGAEGCAEVAGDVVHVRHVLLAGETARHTDDGVGCDVAACLGDGHDAPRLGRFLCNLRHCNIQVVEGGL